MSSGVFNTHFLNILARYWVLRLVPPELVKSILAERPYLSTNIKDSLISPLGYDIQCYGRMASWEETTSLQSRCGQQFPVDVLFLGHEDAFIGSAKLEAEKLILKRHPNSA